MYIVGMILKIIGILLLCLLGIVLVLLLSVLFVPIRYRFHWEKHPERPHNVSVKLSWLLHMLAFSVKYEEKVSYVIRVFGIPIKKGSLQGEGNQIFEKKEKQQNRKEDDSKEVRQQMDEAKKNSLPEKENTKKENIKSSEREMNTQEFNLALSETPKKKSSIWKRWMVKWKAFVAFLKKIPKFFKSMFYKVRDLWQNVDNKRAHALDQFRLIMDFWRAKENQAGKRLLFEKGKRIIKHILPRKWKGMIRFGLSDPGDTGKALAIIAVVGGLVGVMPDIEPDFSGKTLDATVDCSGRLKIGYVIWQILRLWFHEDMQRLKSNFEKVRRAL